VGRLDLSLVVVAIQCIPISTFSIWMPLALSPCRNCSLALLSLLLSLALLEITTDLIYFRRAHGTSDEVTKFSFRR